MDDELSVPVPVSPVANILLLVLISRGGKSSLTSNPVVRPTNGLSCSGHCVKFAPKYEAAAKALREKNPEVRLGKVDCTKNSRLCMDYNIRAYPTMKIFKNGQELYHEYDGPRRVSA